jgi:SAM-dependent methyltransferase
VSFAVGADEYDRFMGRYSSLLAPEFADFARLGSSERVLDVGCGPGALTGELAARLGGGRVAAVDPSPGFVSAVASRCPGVQAARASAEQLPFPDATFDAALAQLVVHFMADPVAGLTEMARVTRRGGAVSACVWDHAGAHGPLSLFWAVAREIDPAIDDESRLPGTREGHLGDLFIAARLHDVNEVGLWVELEHSTFDDWWSPFLLGVGPAGQHVVRLKPEEQSQLRESCRARLPTGSFSVRARAWAARGLV